MNWMDQILSPTNLREAWEEVRENKGSPGIDRVTIKRWGRNWEERLMGMAQEVRANTYQAKKLRQFQVPKKDGTRRTISILTVTDRVLQRAVLRVVDDLFDREFTDCSHGYRSRRGVRSAVPAILRHRDAGRQWVVDADIDDCFPSLNHALIYRHFQRRVNNTPVLGLLKQWMAQGQTRKGVGISLGAVISPLLCNILLHELDVGLLRMKFSPVRYADDFCIFCSSQKTAEKALEATETLLRKLKLTLEPNKTRLTHFDEGFDFLGVHFYRDTYSFTAAEKRVEVKGAFDEYLFNDYVPEEYA